MKNEQYLYANVYTRRIRVTFVVKKKMILFE